MLSVAIRDLGWLEYVWILDEVVEGREVGSGGDQQTYKDRPRIKSALGSRVDLVCSLKFRLMKRGRKGAFTVDHSNY